jgi:hypothetical protein
MDQDVLMEQDAQDNLAFLRKLIPSIWSLLEVQARSKLVKRIKIQTKKLETVCLTMLIR